jgi:hypothetical protein
MVLDFGIDTFSLLSVVTVLALIVTDCYFVMYFIAKFGPIVDYIILCLMAQPL